MFFHKLTTALQKDVSVNYHVYIPPTYQPRTQCNNIKLQHVDVYGYRPLRNSPFELLSVFEFYMYFYAEALLWPEAATATTRTKWTPLGLMMWNEHKAKRKVNPREPMPRWLPGRHYIVIEPEQDEYYTFPSEPVRTYETFRHRWVIVRNRRPYVPVLEGSRVPGPQTAPEDTAKYCSLFFRPWSLIADTIRVPYLANMAFSRDSRAQALEQKTEIKRRRLIGKQEVRSINWKQIWNEYIRENVVSKHAARIIQTFLVNSFSGSSNIHSAEDDNVDDSDADADIPPLTFTREEAQALLNREMPTQLTGDKKNTKISLRRSVRQSHAHQLLPLVIGCSSLSVCKSIIIRRRWFMASGQLQATQIK